MSLLYTHRVDVRFADCDPLGHVNHAVYLTYLEQARFGLWARLWGFTGETAMTAAGGDKRALPAALTEGFQDAFTVGAGFAILGAILTAVLISSRTSREHAEAARRGEVDAVPVAA